MLDSFDNKRTSKLGLAIFLILFGGFLIYMLKAFIVSFLGALIFYVLFKPLMTFLSGKKKWRKGLSAAAILIISFLVILLPVFLMVYMIMPKITLFFSDTSLIMQAIKDADERIRAMTGIRLLTDENLVSLQQKATEYITAFLSESLNMLVILGIMYMVLFYMLKNYGAMEARIKKFLPFHERNVNTFVVELKAQTYSNAVGAPIYGFIQGLVAALGYWIFGVGEPVFWGIMTGLFSFVPFVGSTAIWLPAAAILISAGFVWQGVALIIYGLLIISLVDNFVLIFFQKKFANVHPLVTILGFIIGVSLFGIPGIIFGPLLISYFLILLKIYKEEFIDEKNPESESTVQY
jgi:predicted PurR-regulated permease PerM